MNTETTLEWAYKQFVKTAYTFILFLTFWANILTHWGRATHICVSKLTIIASANGLSPGRRYYLKQCWHIVNKTLRNKFQWNLNRNSDIFFQENAFENVVWKMGSILSRPQCVNNNQRRSSFIDSVSHSLCLHPADDVTSDCTLHYGIIFALAREKIISNE